MEEAGLIDVNKAKMEKTFFEENIAEAKNYEWKQTDWSLGNEEHTHCMICLIAIPDKAISTDSVYYQSKEGWLCSYCFSKFISK